MQIVFHNIHKLHIWSFCFSWEPKRYSSMTIPTGIFNVAVGGALLMAELVPLLLYAGLVYLCSLLIESSIIFNGVLEKTVCQVESGWYEERDSCVRGRSFAGYETFSECLDGLSRESRRISRALEELDWALCDFMFTVLLGNCLLLASILARGFVASSFAGMMSYVRYATLCTPPLGSLLLILNICATLHETVYTMLIFMFEKWFAGKVQSLSGINRPDRKQRDCFNFLQRDYWTLERLCLPPAAKCYVAIDDSKPSFV